MEALITGGTGFIGTNLSLSLAKKGWKVRIFDNLSRGGTNRNIDFLKRNVNGKKLKIVIGDIRDFPKLKDNIGVDVIFHLAAQVAVTNSVLNPREDFEVNALGSLNVLEAARAARHKPVVVYSSTNKVYGNLNGVKIGKGVKENQPLDLYSPYGCSKGAADQYARDYYRIYNLPTVVFRQSCIYGPHQMGVEDQGWVAHFAKKVLNSEPITIFGTGKQVRDLLYVDDLVEAYLTAVKEVKKSQGQVFNIGGGIANSIGIVDAIRWLEKELNVKANLKYAKVRPGDQKIFISDNSKLKKVLGFEIKTSYNDGLRKLLLWLQEEKQR